MADVEMKDTASGSKAASKSSTPAGGKPRFEVKKVNLEKLRKLAPRVES